MLQLSLLATEVELISLLQGRITVKDIGWAITKRAKHAKSRGVWGHAPQEIFEIRCCENASGGL